MRDQLPWNNPEMFRGNSCWDNPLAMALLVFSTITWFKRSKNCVDCCGVGVATNNSLRLEFEEEELPLRTEVEEEERLPVCWRCCTPLSKNKKRKVINKPMRSMTPRRVRSLSASPLFIVVVQYHDSWENVVGNGLLTWLLRSKRWKAFLLFV